MLYQYKKGIDNQTVYNSKGPLLKVMFQGIEVTYTI